MGTEAHALDKENVSKFAEVALAESAVAMPRPPRVLDANLAERTKETFHRARTGQRQLHDSLLKLRDFACWLSSAASASSWSGEPASAHGLRPPDAGRKRPRP
jgi:phosphopantothenoylcysteine synthetase/decarboxylase